MTNSTVTPLVQPGAFSDLLTEVLRSGARRLLAHAVEAEVSGFIDAHAGDRLDDGRARIVRHGHLPERDIQTGIGAVRIQQPRVRDRGEDGSARIHFSPSILPKHARRTKSLDAVLPILYLKGISSGSFQDALSALLGPEAPNLSSDTILRLRESWNEELAHWRARDLSTRRYVYIWADGIYFQARMEDQSQCMLVIIGATPEGRKELLGFTSGYRESAQSWAELLIDLKARGLAHPPLLATGDGALGFWSALGKVFPTTRQQRCWVHKTANILNDMPKAMQTKVKVDLHNIWMAESRLEAEKALSLFLRKYQAKYPKAADRLTRDKDELLAFYDFPAEHWTHIRTTNPIESTFATVRHRTKRSKGCLSMKTMELMVFKVIKEAEKTWLRLRGKNQLPKLITGVKFSDGIEQLNQNNQSAA
ncbi:MAG: IS256 family transposase [Alphaproteobacteria bacterium]|nr:IS256 family transposase [Alphaproteobacteria bacterium]|tara:strand:- start:32 stop:1294 length:1263 start_codon:yes stop_codon:yes gene_type:complete